VALVALAIVILLMLVGSNNGVVGNGGVRLVGMHLWVRCCLALGLGLGQRRDATHEIFPILAPAFVVGENGSWW